MLVDQVIKGVILSSVIVVGSVRLQVCQLLRAYVADVVWIEAFVLADCLLIGFERVVQVFVSLLLCGNLDFFLLAFFNLHLKQSLKVSAFLSLVGCELDHAFEVWPHRGRREHELDNPGKPARVMVSQHAELDLDDVLSQLHVFGVPGVFFHESGQLENHEA